MATESNLFGVLAPHGDGRPFVMGIVNVTPDSFSDGGVHLDARAAIEAGLRMHEEGADVVDVGGESTRPFSASVSVDEELNRVVPVVRGLAAAGVFVSIDTRRAAVMRAAVDAGARLINDVSALLDDPDALPLAAALGCPVVVMYRRGNANTGYEQPTEASLLEEVKAFLASRVEACMRAGIARNAIAIDPGIGFVGASPDDNLPLIKGIGELAALGNPVVIGASRKRFVGTISGEPDSGRRLGGSLAVALAAAERGAAVLRVHDVRETVQALKAQAALR